MAMIILCLKKSFFVYYRLKFQKYNTIPKEVTFKLIAQGNNLQNGKKKFGSFFLLLPYFY